MPVTPTYPGIYIEELPSSTHTITAAPTSIAVFVGYSHPLKTNPTDFGKKAIQLFSFTDYERNFGGFFTNSSFDQEAVAGNFSSLAHAVSQFFLNGGANAYVIPLQAHSFSGTTSGTTDNGAITAPTVTLDTIIFTARELTEAGRDMTVNIDNVQADTADITITYGAGSETQREVFRKVSTLAKDAKGRDNPNYIETRIGTPAKPVSALVTVQPGGTSYPGTFTQGNATFPPAFPANSTIFNVADFTPIFQQDSALDKLSIFNLLVIPGVVNSTILSDAAVFCEQKQAFLIMDPPINQVADQAGANWIGDYMTDTATKSTNAALYFPYLQSTNPLTGVPVDAPPSGTVAGIYARTDNNRGVWKAPAGLETTLVNADAGVVETGRMNDMRQGTLNPLGVNCLRTFPGIGTVVFGARTSVTENPAFQQWRYVPVRRMALFIEQTLYRNLGWVVFEPNDTPLWVAIRTSIENFMLTLFQQGAFQGNTPSKAFQVKCDETTTTQTDIDNGIVNIIVAFAPLKPAEFVIVKIAQLAGQTQA